MRSALVGTDTDLGLTALKALIMFAVAIVGLRLSERRVLAELNVVDVVVAVAVGAIVGRTATSSTTSALTGVVALVVLLVLHRLLSILRRAGVPTTAFDRDPVVLVNQGVVQTHALRHCGLSERDLNRLLRQDGAADISELAFVLYEEQGSLTVVPHDRTMTSSLVAGLREAGVADPGRPE